MKRKIMVFVLLSIFGYSTYCQITRDSAITIVKNRVLGGNWADKEIFASATPIDTLLNVNSNNISRLCKYWNIFVDEQPYANWGHPCKDIFIDVTTGVVHLFNKKMPPSKIINMDIIHRVCPLTTTKSSQLFKIPKPNHPRNVTTSNNEYAVIISGGCNKFSNRERYWNDCSAMYQALVNVYNYDKDKIFVLMADGTNPVGICIIFSYFADLEDNATVYLYNEKCVIVPDSDDNGLTADLFSPACSIRGSRHRPSRPCRSP